MGSRIVFLDRATIPSFITIRRPRFDHEWIDHDLTGPEDVVARARGAAIVITNKVAVSRDTVAALPDLRMIAVAATGTDRIDLAACAARGIVVSNIRGYAGSSVPEHTFALILALRRSLPAYGRSVAAGRWQASGQFCYFDHPIHDLAGATLGIVGMGSIGGAVARLGAAFGMTVLRAARKGATEVAAGTTAFADVLARADVISLHCPLNDETRGLIGQPEFAQMARTPILINTARGGLVDETALAAALRSGRISGAGFDVASAEPPAPDHPFMALLARPDFILTPHVAWASTEAIQTLADQLVDNIEAFEAGTPRNVVGA